MSAPWVYLAVATVFEIGFAVCMKASEGFTRPWPTAGLVVSAIGGTTCLTLALRTLPVGVAYPIWTGLGAVGTVLLGGVLFGERLAPLQLASVALIIAGVVGLRAA